MGVYRVEASPNNRATCINKECKTAGVKIMKGEFRYAIQVTIKEHQSWQYKHWGCVTPAQIDNLIETSGGDTEMVDGYDDLSEEYQKKVDFALKNGHVPDEDWKGDVEANRDGHKGMRLSKTDQKKKEKAEPAANDDEKPKKKRGRKTKADDNEEDEAPAPKKRGRPVKKEAEDEDEAPAPKKARAARGKKVEYKEEEDDEDETPAPKKSRAKAKKAAESEDEITPEAEPEEEDEIEEGEEVEEAPKPKRGKAAAKGTAKASQKRGRKKAVTDAE
ncbi:zf-PARP-domain-containing protein [Didymella exigua CBS 183.55]|uniref:Zf-PARP-domain-containing protein n=1 Tax=Didymella exigua CBS 183.55 TaxID=1150837 RepID=A0A6A5RVS6_9PLEO|nr:zf-PARP-domain-containing protein [Didymella exigua CBS 183.55]KAF1932571.1 zf-PARP-domain-containing protein [Didymella exigua CBS 183.55]